jgi:hypothetical protein
MSPHSSNLVMPGLVRGIYVLNILGNEGVIAGTSSAKTRFALKPGHDGGISSSKLPSSSRPSSP